MRMACPLSSGWRKWGENEYIYYFLSLAAARKRLRVAASTFSQLRTSEFEEFVAPIRHAILQNYGAEEPVISVVIRAHNEERELLPTLVSHAFVESPGVPMELIVVDNASTDGTGRIADACGVRRVACRRKGIGYATQAGYRSISPSSEFVFITDADVRMTRPFKAVGEFRNSTVIKTSHSFLMQNCNCMGVSTGMLYEASHWSHSVLRAIRSNVYRRSPISYWTGPNQFFRRVVLDAAGGINPRVEFGYGEDFCRLYTVARYCKKMGFDLLAGGSAELLVDPVFQSGRRFATLSRTARNAIFVSRKNRREIGDDGWPVFKEDGAVEKDEIRL